MTENPTCLSCLLTHSLMRLELTGFITSAIVQSSRQLSVASKLVMTDNVVALSCYIVPTKAREDGKAIVGRRAIRDHGIYRGFCKGHRSVLASRLCVLRKCLQPKVQALRKYISDLGQDWGNTYLYFKLIMKRE
jgi:hypothetical protein